MVAPLISFVTSRSGGKGGQHVNKVESKVTGILFLKDISFLTPEELIRLQIKLNNKMLEDGSVRITSQTERSQRLNKEIVIKKFVSLISRLIVPEKLRKKSMPSRAAVAKRLEKKKKQSEKKSLRKNSDYI